MWILWDFAGCRNLPIISLSRRQQGFEPPWGRQILQTDFSFREPTEYLGGPESWKASKRFSQRSDANSISVRGIPLLNCGLTLNDPKRTLLI
jgi:hypothetical protein